MNQANSSERELIEVQENIELEDLKRLQQIVRDQLVEPFTGHRSLETMQKTRSGVEKGLGKLRRAGAKAGKWISCTRVAAQSQEKISNFIQELKEKPGTERLSVFFERINQSTEEIQVIAKKSVAGIEEKTKRLTLLLIEKGLELMLYDDTSKWIIKRSGKCLGRTDIHTLEDVRELSSADRQKLIDDIYPYDSQLFKKYMKGFDMTVNLGMGAVVATNIPGTGIAMSVVNMGKTLVKVGNRIGIMSAIYGRQMSGKTALFKISASVIRSLEEWESNEQHKPLDPAILDDLFDCRAEKDEEAFQDLLNSVFKKDAYIAIPGVGMISLGKINLDDMKMEMMVLRLVQNHEEKIRLVDRYGEQKIDGLLKEYKDIYKTFLEYDIFKTLRKQPLIEEEQEESNRWRSRLKLLTGEDLTVDTITEYLDSKVREIYEKTRHLSEPERSDQVRKAVENILSS